MRKKVHPIFLIMLTLLSCSTTEPIPVNENIKIAEIDAAVIEAYLNIQIENPSPSKKVVIERNGETVISFTASKTDTAITDTDLTENMLYKYKAKLTENGKVIGESSEISVTTMQPTSHEFMWETFTFGEHSSSSLYEVAIIDENNIWAVGEIYMRDSTGKLDYQPYNAAHWDGAIWMLYKIKFYTFCNQNHTNSYPAKSIITFNANNIWITSGSQITHFNGINQLNTECIPISVYKLWGESSSNIYAVGYNGGITHYLGSSWQKIESGTDVHLKDIAFTENDNKLWISGYSTNYNNSILLYLNNNTITKIWEREGTSTNPYGNIIQSIWGKDNRLYIVSDEGVFLKHTTMNLPDKKLSFNPIWKYRITGTDHNDIYTTGDNSVIMHYNGKDWKEVYRLNNNLSIQYSATAKNNLMVSVGTVVEDAVYHKASIIILRKN